MVCPRLRGGDVHTDYTNDFGQVGVEIKNRNMNLAKGLEFGVKATGLFVYEYTIEPVFLGLFIDLVTKPGLVRNSIKTYSYIDTRVGLFRNREAKAKEHTDRFTELEASIFGPRYEY